MSRLIALLSSDGDGMHGRDEVFSSGIELGKSCGLKDVNIGDCVLWSVVQSRLSLDPAREYSV